MSIELVMSYNHLILCRPLLLLRVGQAWPNLFQALATYWGFPGGSVVKNPPAMQETQVQSLGWEDPLEKEMVTHSNIVAW